MIKAFLLGCILMCSTALSFAATNDIGISWTSPDKYENGEILLPTDIAKYEIVFTAPDGTTETIEVDGSLNSYDHTVTAGEGVYIITMRVMDSKYSLWSDDVEVTVLIEDPVDNSASKIHFNIKIEITHNG